METISPLQRVRAERIRRKQADSGQAFADAIQQMSAQQLRSDALHDVANLGMLSLGAGAAGRGAIGLFQLLRRGRPRKSRSGPVGLPLPVPVKAGSFLGGDAAASKSGIPWYGPAMLGAGLAGLGLGWKGVDAVLDSRRRRETQEDLDQSREAFHAALLGQYDQPLKLHSIQGKVAEDQAPDSTVSVMLKVSEALDKAFARVESVLAEAQTPAPPPLPIKSAIDWSNIAGQAAGGYGMYAGLSSLLTGALIYDKIQKRSRRAVLEKALQRRQRRKFMQQPTEVYAVPEPVPVPQESFQ